MIERLGDKSLTFSMEDLFDVSDHEAMREQLASTIRIAGFNPGTNSHL